jgi:pyrroloquinoline quinone (PQQ) biosynthesis protein C
MNSASKIFRGTALEFVDTLCAEAKGHRALKHPFLRMLGSLEQEEADAVLRDFVFQYSFYSRYFDAYNDAVLATANDSSHRAVILKNIADEQGTGGPGFSGLPHREMSRRFSARVGIDDAYRASHRPLTTVLVWQELFMQMCASPVPGVGLAAISIGTEYIVPDVYGHLLQLIGRSSFRDIEEKYFFTLHKDCDVEHSRDLILVLRDFCEDPSHREAVRFGALSALSLRAAFFDVMAERVKEIKCKGKARMLRIYMTAPRPNGVEIRHGAYPT